jgi:hypothetical protein
MTNEFSQPQTIRRAALCLWISTALTLVVTAAQVLNLVPIEGATLGMTTAIGVLTAGLLALIAILINARRNWGRWLFAVIFILGTLSAIALIFTSPHVFLGLPKLLQANMVSQIALQTAALFLMFSSKSQQWFGTQRS